jgi:hypothetical protein
LSGTNLPDDTYTMANRKGYLPRRIVFMVVIVITMLGTAHGQVSPFLDFIGAAERDGKVFLQWVMSSGATCDGIDVYRSTDGELFERIGRIPGVCGSPDFALGYEFVDESPLINRINYYRLELGNLGVSEVLAIHVFDFREKKFQIIPHPVSSRSILFFENPQLENNSLAVYNLLGDRVYEVTGQATQYAIKATDFAEATYIFVITNSAGKKLAQGKLMVVNGK